MKKTLGLLSGALALLLFVGVASTQQRNNNSNSSSGVLTFGTHLAAGAASYNGSTAATLTSDATNANTASTIVARDASGNFIAGTIIAGLIGPDSGTWGSGGINGSNIGATTPGTGAFTTVTAIGTSAVQILSADRSVGFTIGVNDSEWYLYDGAAPITVSTANAVSLLAGSAALTLASSLYTSCPALSTNSGDVVGCNTGLATLASPNFSGHLRYNGAAPTLSACGTSPSIDANATDNAGTVTVGSAATGCVITFAAGYSTFNHCRVTSESAISGLTYSYTKTAITVSASVLGGDLVDYNCDGA
jgi:hypothetical protein